MTFREEVDQKGSASFFVSAHLRAGAVSGPECRRRSKGRGRSEQRERGSFRALKMRPVRQEAVFGTARLRNCVRCGRGCFWHDTPLKMRPAGRRLSTVCGVGCSAAFEDASRTTGACFEHRVPLKTPSVQKKGVFMHRMPFSYRSVLS